MNFSLVTLETCVVAVGLVLLLADLWLPPERKRLLGYAGAAALGFLLLASLSGYGSCSLSGTAFDGMYIQDDLAIFFKRFFLLAGVIVLVLAVEFSDHLSSGVSEYYSLIVFALTGMLFAASANDFSLLFVSMELITVTFYVLTSFQRGRLVSLEAGVKYLIIGALSTAFTVYGIALIFGSAHTLKFGELAAESAQLAGNKIFLCGLLLVLVGIGFKISAVPFQIWVPDVYQGAPTPTSAFLAVGSKAAGFVLLLRLLFTAVPDVTTQWRNLLILMSGVTILYGNLCALPQRNVKRLLGYSSISHAGYMLLGVAALSASGQAAILYYLCGYLFTILAAFTVIALVMRHLDSEDISGFAGLSQRSPLLAATMALAMVSLGGIPPLAGFFGKFLLFRAILQEAAASPGYYCLTFTAIAGVVMSLYYYFGVIRAIYWSRETPNPAPISVSLPARCAVGLCIVGMLWLGLFPGLILGASESAALSLNRSGHLVDTRATASAAAPVEAAPNAPR